MALCVRKFLRVWIIARRRFLTVCSVCAQGSFLTIPGIYPIHTWPPTVPSYFSLFLALILRQNWINQSTQPGCVQTYKTKYVFFIMRRGFTRKVSFSCKNVAVNVLYCTLAVLGKHSIYVVQFYFCSEFKGSVGRDAVLNLYDHVFFH